MREKMKKYLGFILAALMVFALTPVGAFAAEAGEQTLTIQNPVKDHTYKVYQILTGDVSKSDGTVLDTLANAKAGSALQSDADVKAIAEKLSEQSGEADKARYVGGLLRDDATPIATLPNAEGAYAATVPTGYYLIKDIPGESAANATTSLYVVTLVGDVTVTPKNPNVPVVDKTIENGVVDGSSNKVSTAAIGGTVSYDIAGTIPDMTAFKYYYYVLRDTLAPGLDFDPASVKVYLDEDELGADAYTLLVGEDAGDYTFMVAFKNIKAIENIATYEKVHVKYNAKVNANAVVGTDSNDNAVNLQYSNDPNQGGNGTPNGVPGADDVTGVTPDSITKTYVAELAITKVDGDTSVPLTGATFRLQGENLESVVLVESTEYVVDENGAWYLLNAGTYTKKGPSEETADQYADTTTKYSVVRTLKSEATPIDNKAIEATVDENGVLVFRGLSAGTYTLSEIVTPTGYNTIEDMTFTIGGTFTGSVETGSFGMAWNVVSDPEIQLDGSATGLFSTDIENYGGLRLPSTGGIGTVIFYTVGGLLVIGAIAYLVKRRRTPSTK